jgi:hypothetical protein
MQDILAGQVDVGLEACVVMDEIEVTTLASGDFRRRKSPRHYRSPCRENPNRSASE